LHPVGEDKQEAEISYVTGEEIMSMMTARARIVFKER
jgi:hypothetical protein